MAAATENDYDRKDHNPSAVIVKDVAQAVIHYVCLRELVSRAFGIIPSTVRLILSYAVAKFVLIKVKAYGAVLYNQLCGKALSRLRDETVKLRGRARREKPSYLSDRHRFLTNGESHSELTPLAVAHTAEARIAADNVLATDWAFADYLTESAGFYPLGRA